MKKYRILILMIVGILSIGNTQIFAHPGRTDSSGGHTCRTNCSKWGLADNEYHYHNGGGSSGGESNDSSSGGGASSSDTTQAEAPPVRDYYSEGYNQGLIDGRNGTSSTPATIPDTNAQYIEGYKKSFAEAYNQRIEEEKNAKIQGEQEGYNFQLQEKAGKYQQPAVPEGINAKYIEGYKTGWDKAHKENIVIVEKLAVENSEKQITDDRTEKITLAEEWKGYTEVYTKKYNENYSLRDSGYRKMAQQNGYTQGRKIAESNKKFIEDYSMTGFPNGKVYVKIYQDNYQKGWDDVKSEQKSLLISRIVLAVIVLATIVGGVFFYEYRIKKANKKVIQE